jgi:hypothetical protein
MIGFATFEVPTYRPHYSGARPRKSERRRFIVRPWSAEKFDLPVYDFRGNEKINVSPEDSVTIINSKGDCWYAARYWFGSDPTDSDAWASAAWKFLGACARKKARCGARS